DQNVLVLEDQRPVCGVCRGQDSGVRVGIEGLEYLWLSGTASLDERNGSFLPISHHYDYIVLLGGIQKGLVVFRRDAAPSNVDGGTLGEVGFEDLGLAANPAGLGGSKRLQLLALQIRHRFRRRSLLQLDARAPDQA